MSGAGADALLVVSFGGPEGPDEVMPFLERVTRGRGVPRERLERVAEHYHHFGGVSPINARSRELVAALRETLARPVYWGNRFSAPWLADAIREMRDDGVTRALALATSALGSHSGCRAYLEDIERARAEVEGAPVIRKIRPFADHPGYVETCAARLAEALPPGDHAHVVFTAHSIPVAMAARAPYEGQLARLAERVARAAGVATWRVAYQSRSGPPGVPWLEPDVVDALRAIAADDPVGTAVIAPFGFVADHMEVVWDLDVEARAEAERLGLGFVRAPAANAHPRFVRMIAELLETEPLPCPSDCCPPR